MSTEGGPGSALSDLVSQALRRQILGLRTCLPARVETVRPAEQAVDVQPLIRSVVMVDGREQERPLPKVTRVPVQLPRWGGYVLRMFPVPGDTVTLIVADRELDRWLAGSGDPITPRSGRTHSLDDCIATPPISPWGGAIEGLDSDELVLGREDGSGHVRIAANGGVFIGPAGSDAAAARVGDEVTIDESSDPAFVTWIRALSPLTVAPYTAPIRGRITSGADGE